MLADLGTSTLLVGHRTVTDAKGVLSVKEGGGGVDVMMSGLDRGVAYRGSVQGEV